MSRRTTVVSTIFCLMAAAFLAGCKTPGVDGGGGPGFRFPVGFGYVSGLNDIVDLSEDNLEAEGFGVDSATGIPVGLTFRPYYQFENGIAVGADLGPLMLIIGDVDFLNVPVSVTGRYYFLPDSTISPYVRGGLSYNIATGDYVEGSDIGFVVGAGVELWRNKVANLGLEIGYDSSAIDFESKSRVRPNSTESIEPSGFVVSLVVIF